MDLENEMLYLKIYIKCIYWSSVWGCSPRKIVCGCGNERIAFVMEEWEKVVKKRQEKGGGEGEMRAEYKDVWEEWEMKKKWYWYANVKWVSWINIRIFYYLLEIQKN